MDFSALNQFAQSFAQVAPVLEGVPGGEHDQLRETAAEFDAEIAQPPAEGRQAPAALRRAVDQSHEGVPSATAAVATELAHKAAGAIGHFPM